MHATRPLRNEADLRTVLSAAFDLIEPAGYRLVGTGAALLQGVALPTGDIDVLYASREGVDDFAAALAGCAVVQAPIWLPEARQYFAAFVLDGVGVSASTVEHEAAPAGREWIGEGAWRHYVEVPCGRHVVPATRLELRLVSELVRDRPDRCRPLVAHLREHGADLALLERAMRGRDVPEAVRMRVLAELTG